MRKTVVPAMNRGRVTTGPMATPATDAKPVGAFLYQLGPHTRLFVLAHDGVTEDVTGWEHVSVSVHVKHRGQWRPIEQVPDWPAMCLVKNAFWEPEECVLQFHPPKSQYVDNAPVLHLWRHVTGNPDLPPMYLVGIPGATPAQAKAIAEELQAAGKG